MNPDIGRHAREGGRAKARRRLTLERVEAELGTLDTPENIRAAYERIQRWACAGLLAGSVAGSAVRACDGALRLYEAQLDRDGMKALEARIAELEAELAARAASR